jgi:hypothetical protein
MKKTFDRPPILRFLVMFFGLLAVALGLAALAPSVESSNGAAASAGGGNRSEPEAEVRLPH